MDAAARFRESHEGATATAAVLIEKAPPTSRAL